MVAGHITSGGQFATLHYREIFEDCDALDSVILFEAEHAIVALAEALRIGDDFQIVPSLAWRESRTGEVILNRSTPAPQEIDSLSYPVRKEVPAEYLGLGAANMIGSRGCHAACKYCCVSALANDRRIAAKASGAQSFTPGTRRRTPESIAAEIAQLYHESGVRIFEFQDDNWIPPIESLARDYFNRLASLLEKTGVGQIGFTLKLGSASLTRYR